MFNKKNINIKNYYDKFHERLEDEHTHIYEPTFRIRKKFQSDIIAQFSGTGKYALDIGCGTGHITTVLLKQGFIVDAVDPSFKAINILKKKFKNSFWGKIKFYTTPLQTFNPGKQYDIIICYEVLEHIKDDYKALRHLVSLLKRNGIIIIDVPLHPHLYSKADELCGHYRRYTVKRINNLLEQSNLQEIKRYYFGFPMIYASKLLRKIFQNTNIEVVKKLSKKSSKKLNMLLKLYDKFLFIDRRQFAVPLADDIIVIARKV